MNFILRLKHWHVFLILLTGSITSNFTWENNEIFNFILNSIGLIIYFFWYFAVGLELTENLPVRVELNRTLFIVNAFFLIFSLLIIITVYDGSFSSNGALDFFWVVYFMFAIFQFMFFPSKALRSVELKTEATFGQYFGYFFLTIFWPFGIWWIQPKLNNILDNK
jgi:hypothetical protein